MRVRSQWFNSTRPRTPEDIASAVAFISWRIAQNALQHVRKARFDVEVGPQYFAFLQEFLIFLTQLADRIVFRQYHWHDRVAFVTALAHRMGDILAENQADLLGYPARDSKERFISLLNERADTYAECSYAPADMNFAFVRYLGHSLQSVMHSADQVWIVDQIMAIEAPEAIETLEKALKNLLDDTPREERQGPLTGPD